jgi:magnesium transporter
MLSIYQWQNGSLREVVTPEGPCWINLADPSTEEILRVQTLTGVSREFLSAPLDRDERPRLDVDDDGSLLIVVHIPYHEPDENLHPFNTLPLGVVHTTNAVITVCNRSTPIAASYLDQILRDCPPEQRFRFTFHLLWRAAILYLRYLRDIRQRADMVEQELHESISNEGLMRLLNIEKSLVYFTTSLKADDILLGRIRTTRQLDIDEDDLDVLEDVRIEYQQALDMATIHSNILTGTLDAFASIISNNLNNVMKFLTSMTIVLTVPMLIASIFGMNTWLPFANAETWGPMGFIMILGIAFLLMILTVIFFARRRFF